MLIPHYFEDLKILHENTMPNRSYYIPASKSFDSPHEARAKSDRLQLLSGTWKFRYYDSVYHMSDEFWDESYELSGFDEIPVPSVWQMHGYDSNQYTNVRYPFPFDPPYVPRDNPCGAYVTEFDYHADERAPHAHLNFEGVDSCFYVWLNGKYVGYSQVPHSTSEFDVTDYVREGGNRLAVLVLKWCDGSYLEDQDKFRMSGIFRDVYILKRPYSYVADYFIKTSMDDVKSPSYADVSIELTYVGGAADTHIEITDDAGIVVASADVTGSKATVTLRIDTPVLWSAENPYLYRIIISTDDEVITDRIGVRDIRIEDKRVLINGVPIKFRGINRHDSDPVTGFAVTREQIMRDLTLMRQYNFNAIRTSHYPNVPYFYELCDEFGFYVIDEADIEAHGPSELYYSDNSWENKARRWNEPIADNPDFCEPILDRVQRCVTRDKNRACVVIWSMGNESAYGVTFEKALAWTKSYDSSRLTHYESAQYTGGARKYDYSNLDLYSRMYPSLAEMDEYIEGGGDKPFILCEYCHAMGNGPGDLEDYFEYFDTHDTTCGGFIWEWCDHAIYMGEGEQGRAIYHYGGDSGETVHDGNFCMDGMVYPDRTPHTGLAEYKNVHRPVRVTSYDEESGELTLRNLLDFTDLADAVTISYEVRRDGAVAAVGDIEVPHIAPHKTGNVNLRDITVTEKQQRETAGAFGNTAGGTAGSAAGDVDGDTAKSLFDILGDQDYLKIIYSSKHETALVPQGHPLGFDEIKLSGADAHTDEFVERICKQYTTADTDRNLYLDPLSHSALDGWLAQGNNMDEGFMFVAETCDTFTVIGAGFNYVFDRSSGNFSSLERGGEELLANAPTDKNIWRAPTDNDRNIKNEWYRAHYDMAYERTYETSYEIVGCGADDGDMAASSPAATRKVVITCDSSIGAPTVQRILTIHTVWEIDAYGMISAAMHVTKNPEFPYLPRFGVRMILPDIMYNVRYLGMGPYESYIDKHRASWHGQFSSIVDYMHEDYIMPQENGSHWDCRYVRLASYGNETESGQCDSDTDTMSEDYDDCDVNRHSITIVSDKPFSFNVSPYTEEELTAAAHNYELPDSERTVLCIDYAMSGIGSNSCGPALAEKYQLDETEFDFGFRMIIE